MLALGFRLRHRLAGEPAAVRVTVLLVYLLVQELFNRHTARISLVLLMLFPMVRFHGMNFMTHTFNLTCTVAALLLVAWARRTGRSIWAILAGGMVGVSSIVRPVDGLIGGILVGLWVIGVGGRRLRCSAPLRPPELALFLLGSAVLPYNQALTGKPLSFPLTIYMDEHFGPGKNNLGFRSQSGIRLGPGPVSRPQSP